MLQKLREQIEFYFSDSNYSKDKFMLARASENDGFIPIQVLLTFKRLKSMNPTVDQIKEALKDSTVVELKEDSLRKVETEEYKEYLNDKEINKRILYMKGFTRTATLDDIKELLFKYCKPIRVTLRRDMTREFKGSCFAEFKTKEEAEEVMKLRIPVTERELGGAEGERSEGETAKENVVEGETENVVTETETAEKVKRVKKGDETAETQGETGAYAETEAHVSSHTDLSPLTSPPPRYLEILPRDDYLATKKNSKDEKREEAFEKRVKENFLQKLYTLHSEGEGEGIHSESNLEIKEIKEALPNCAFVDLPNKVVRMKFVEEWGEKEFPVGGQKVRLVKMGEEEGREYLKKIKIKRVGK